MIVVQHSPRLVQVNIYGEFTLADYQEFEAAALAAVHAEGPPDLLFDLREMTSVTLDVAWEDIVFARAHSGDFRRIAVVTDSQWVAWSAWLIDVFVGAEMRVCNDDAEASAWLQGL
ncbi:STAS/SEC14 domain-containing protein [Dentiradicibacter hellwigii]|uniref:STAS/SEC14 domain-containing protein n=1 Tax=Dentiradicibacter hellwigii TaxID=3149053 RepID=A0ABV4UFG0_9RHOO